MYLIRLCILLSSSMDTVGLVTHCKQEKVLIDNHEVENFAMVGVKMCSTKCTTRDYCWSIGYNVVTLMCHVLKLRLESREDCAGFTFIPKRNTSIQAGPCSSKTCRDSRCMKTRSGRDVCVKGKETKQHYQIRLNTKLVRASMDGDMNRVKYHLPDARADIISADINTRGLHRKTPVMFAAEKAHRDMFDFLVGRGADLSLVDESGSTILHIACEGGNLDIINFILTYNIVDINSMDEQECTPAMKAALNGHKDVFNLLVTKGSDLSLVDDSSNTILHMACEGGNLDIVNYVLTQNIVDINSSGNNGRTPAMDAALKGHKDVFDLIVKKGTDLSLSDGRGDSILHAACWGGNVEIVKYILTQNIVDINMKGQDKSTPVLTAAYKGHKEVFNVLVRKKADVLVRESSNNGILHLACLGGNIEIIKYILTNCSIDVNDVGEDGFTPAMIAASKGRKDMFDLLLQNGADLSQVDDILRMACEGGNMELVKHIFEQNTVEINSQSDIGWTPAMEAAYEGHLEVLKLLVSKGADLTLVNDEDNNILHVAFEGKHMEVVKYVLTYDFVDVNSRGNEEMTPAIFAAKEGLTEIFDLVVRKGADLSSITDDKDNVLHVACEEGNTEIVKYVLTQNAVNINAREVWGKTPVLVAAEYGYEDIFDLLVGEGADLSLVDAKGENILHKVSVVGNVDMAKQALTQKNIVQDINRKDLSGMTPVMAAAISGHKEVFDLLVKKGADLTLVDGDGNSILHLACRGNVEIVKYLLSHNIVDINRKGTLNKTPVMVAAHLGKKATFELLLKQGADMLLVDDDGNNIFHAAVNGGNVDIVKHFLANPIVDITAKNKYGSNAVMMAKAHRSLHKFLLSQGFSVK